MERDGYVARIRFSIFSLVWEAEEVGCYIPGYNLDIFLDFWG